jgi:hypothetical protein
VGCCGAVARARCASRRATAALLVTIAEAEVPPAAQRLPNDGGCAGARVIAEAQVPPAAQRFRNHHSGVAGWRSVGCRVAVARARCASRRPPPEPANVIAEAQVSPAAQRLRSHANGYDRACVQHSDGFAVRVAGPSQRLALSWYAGSRSRIRRPPSADCAALWLPRFLSLLRLFLARPSRPGPPRAESAADPDRPPHCGGWLIRRPPRNPHRCISTLGSPI